MDTASRRKFLKSASIGVALGSLPLYACEKPTPAKSLKDVNFNFNSSHVWKMVTTWPPNFPVVGEGCSMLAKWVEEMSGGRMKIQVFGGGELVPSFECFDAVQHGAVEMGHGASYYWAGKIPSGQYFSSVPFGLNTQQMYAWIISGGGLALWEELYAPYGLLPIPAGNTGLQMGGWFNKEINTAADLDGIKMRIPGLGGKLLNKVGGTSVSVAGGEIYTNLERGVIDATEWIGPYHDYLMGFYQVAKYYYYPGWHEPGTMLEMIINKEKFEALPTDLQEIIRVACYRLNHWMWTEFDAQNSKYLKKLVKEEGTIVKAFPTEMLQTLKSYMPSVLADLSAADPRAVKIGAAYQKFSDDIQAWSQISDKVVY
jgi:TRAP-type mannitol/chloroaromatic compound transport system substrate-binding protein